MNIFNLFKKKPKQHEVPILDVDGNVMGKTMESLRVSHLVNHIHKFETYTTYSIDTHYEGGMILHGLIPLPPFPH